MASPPRRPWTPTERPGDASYTSPVVYHGDRQVGESDAWSEKSGDDKERPSPGGIEVVSGEQGPKSKLISSATLRAPDPASGPEVQTYQPYMHVRTEKKADGDQAGSPGNDSLFQGWKPTESHIRYRRSQMQLSREDEASPPANPPRQPQVAPSPDSVDDNVAPRPRRLSQTPKIENHSDLPFVTGKSTRQININILLINPNSTKSMTDRCLESIQASLPINVTVYGFTPSRPAPTAIESQTDAIMSTAACMKAILPIASKYDAFLVACFSHHPLIAALREQLMQPVIGIMEASLYTARMCGSKFGIVTTGVRSMHLLDASTKNVYGMQPFSVGTESSRLGVLDLETRSEEEVEERLAKAARKLQARGADCICLGCAGMTHMAKACQGAVGMHDRMAMVIDGVNMGIHFLIGLVRENLGTAKGGGYNTNSGHKSLSV